MVQFISLLWIFALPWFNLYDSLSEKENKVSNLTEKNYSIGSLNISGWYVFFTSWISIILINAISKILKSIILCRYRYVPNMARLYKKSKNQRIGAYYLRKLQKTVRSLVSQRVLLTDTNCKIFYYRWITSKRKIFFFVTLMSEKFSMWYRLIWIKEKPTLLLSLPDAVH